MGFVYVSVFLLARLEKTAGFAGDGNIAIFRMAVVGAYIRVEVFVIIYPDGFSGIQKTIYRN